MKTIEVARRKERGSLFHCLNHHRQSEVAGGRIIALPPLGSLGILMPSIPAICNVMNRSTTFQYCLRSP